MKRSLGILGVGALLAFALAACSSGTPAVEQAQPTPTEAMAAPTDTPLPEPTATTDTGYDTLAAFAGTWSGSWTNTTFGSTGDLTATIEVNPDGTATFTFDPGGFVFGAFDPPEITFQGTYDASGVTIDLPGDEVFGDVTVTFNPDGTFEMVGDIIPTAGIARVEASGTFTDTTMDGTYTVFFDNESLAEGTVTMTKES
ncbi:MAG: hypothetical protein P8X64_11710 [Anaerolineales bacterium]